MHPQADSLSPESRIDPAHPVASRRASAPGAAIRCGDPPLPHRLAAALATSHVEALIPRLQQWAADLDAREARLNARQATLEHEERAFRMWSQTQRQELQELRRAAEHQHDRLQREIRALALQQWAPGRG